MASLKNKQTNTIKKESKLTVCSCHVTYAYQSESTLYSYLNVNELLARSRREIWRLSDCNCSRTQNDLLRRNEHSTILPNGWMFVYKLSGSEFESSCSQLKQTLHNKNEKMNKLKSDFMLQKAWIYRAKQSVIQHLLPNIFIQKTLSIFIRYYQSVIFCRPMQFICKKTFHHRETGCYNVKRVWWKSS